MPPTNYTKQNRKICVIPTRAFGDPNLSLTVLCTLVVIGTFSNRDGFCFPSYSTLGKVRRISKQAIAKHVKQLISCGYLKVHHRYNEKTGAKISSILQILFDPLDAKDEKQNNHIDGEVTQLVDGGSTSRVDAFIKNNIITKTLEGGVAPTPSTAARKSVVTMLCKDVVSPDKASVEQPNSAGRNSISKTKSNKDSSAASNRVNARNGASVDVADDLYHKVRPNHLAIPRTDKYVAAIEILNRYIENYKGDLDAAANALRPFAQEADRRGIRETNLCWLTEWAAVGKIPPATKNTGRYKREMSRPLDQNQPQTQKRGYDYETWPWEKKKFIAILDGYMRKVMSHQEFFKHSTDELVDMFFDIVAKKLPEGLEPGQTLRICFDDENIFEGELEEIIHSTLKPERITHLVVDGEAIDALQLVEAKEISCVS